uniref:HYR domain-containing protein n=1 Tax=Ditylenchus dipsaci TaxID=166011 RepID=A0A915DPR4_9BILA
MEQFDTELELTFANILCQLDLNAWINLGDAVNTNSSASPIEKESKFVGSITKVNVWTRVLDFEQEVPSIVQRCQGSPVLYNGLALRFSGYDNFTGKVEKITKSLWSRFLSPASNTRCKIYGDLMDSPTAASHILNSFPSKISSAVKVNSCPNDIFIVTPLKEVNVSWAEPTFSSSDPMGSIRKSEQSLKSGQVFTWGEYTVLYVAYTNDSSLAECTFKVHVTREYCPDLEDPANGIQACESWGPNLKYKACSIQCESAMHLANNQLCSTHALTMAFGD